jgi:hypothetical protein
VVGRGKYMQIGRIAVQDQTRQKIGETPSQQKKIECAYVCLVASVCCPSYIGGINRRIVGKKGLGCGSSSRELA